MDITEQLLAEINTLKRRVGELELREGGGGGGSGTDENAIHDNVAGEINAITEKATPAQTDIVLIEDSAASWAKKKASIYKLLGGWSAAGDNVSSIFGTVAFYGGPGRAHFHELEMPIWSDAPAAPASGWVRGYINAAGRLALIDSVGNIAVYVPATHDHTSGNGAQVDHTGLANLNSTNHTHLTAANHTDLTDGGSTTLHTHPGEYVPVAPTNLIDSAGNTWGGATRAAGSYTFRPGDNSSLWPSTAKAVYVMAIATWSAADAGYYLVISKDSGGIAYVRTQVQVANIPMTISGNVALDGSGYFYGAAYGSSIASIYLRILGYYR